MPVHPLDGCRVVDRTTEIAGPYCSKLFADAGADVVKVEPEGGDPLRGWRSGALFEYLNASKRSVTGAHDELIATADIVITDRVDDRSLADSRPGLVVVVITPFGCDGPWAGRPATEFTLQAASGSTGSRGVPERPPVPVGGRLGEWITGSYAAVGALAALRRARATGDGECVDVAMLDCMTITMTTYPTIFSSFLGWPSLRGTGRMIEVPSIEPTSDGYVVFTTNSAQQFQDFLVLIGQAELQSDHALANALQRFRRRDEFTRLVAAHVGQRTSNEVLEEAALFRIPAGPVLDAQRVLEFEHFRERGVFVTSPSRRFREPRTPYRIEGIASKQREPAPAMGADTGTVAWEPRSPAAADERTGTLPLTGLRVIDCTAWWAGPYSTHVLACLGADVIKVESVTRPDQMRFSATKPPTEDHWWDWSPMYHAANAGKRAVTIDLTRPEGIALFEALVQTADVLVENYTPRVMDQFGLTWERLHALNESLVFLRMPGFGLDGPWRDRTGFAQTMECITGMAWVTGPPDGSPVLPRGACDPIAGLHAVFAALLTLDQRERDGLGRLVEVPMVEAALNVAAEQVVEFDAAGVVLSREGARGELGAPQGVYCCAGDDTWVAVAVTNNEQWDSLCAVLDWSPPASLSTVPGRRQAHDDIDERIARWCVDREPEAVAAELSAAGVPCEVVIAARDVLHNPQVKHRGLFESEHHPITGAHDLPGMPFRFASVERWIRRPSPTLGQHNDEVLGSLPSVDLAGLRSDRVIGDRPVGM